MKKALLILLLISTAPALRADVTTLDQIRDMPPNTWARVPGTKLRNLPAANPCNFGVFEEIMTQWSGGVYDSVEKRLLIWGGGLGGYKGNEMYAFNMNETAEEEEEILQWERVSDAYCQATIACQEPFGDGTPMTRHTYNQMAFIAHADGGRGRFFVHGGAKNCPTNPFPMNITWTYGLSDGTWEQRNPGGDRPSGNYESNCSYDATGPAPRKVYCQFARDGFYSYDFDNNAWTRHNSHSGDASTYAFSSTIDTRRRLFIQMGSGSVITYDLASPALTRAFVVTTGDVPPNLNNGNYWDPPLDYDPSADRVVLWGQDAVYSLNMDTKVWTRHAAPGAPAKTSSNALEPKVYGRWRYVTEVNAFIAATSVDEDVFFYKFTAGDGVIPTPNPTHPARPRRLRVQ